MNIISFEERTFEGIAAKFEYFVQRVDNLCRRHGEKKIDEWMDNHEQLKFEQEKATFGAYL